MDPLSISSAIAGLVSLVDIVYQTTTKYVKQVKDSTRSVKSLLAELKDFSILLHSLKLVAYELEMESGVSTHNTSSHSPNLKFQLVFDCQQILNEIKRGLANIDKDMSSSSAIKRVKARLKWPFSAEETNNLIEKLQRHKQTINLAIAVDSLEKLRTCISSQEDSTNKLDHIQTTVAEILDIQTRISLDRTTQEVLRFFDRDINNASVFDMHKSRRHPLTCLWFTQGQEFEHWRDHPGSSIWITGIPGAGKSIISSAIIAECLQSTAYCHGVTSGTTSLAYFFCSYSDEKTHNIINILSSLASQIARQDKRAFKMLETYYQDLQKHSQIPAKPSAKQLTEIIVHMSTLFHQMYIVVDGLDECGDDAIAVAQTLSKLPQDDKCLTLALLSRMELHIQKWLEESFVHVEVEAHTEDIELYVAAELDERITSGQLRLKDVTLKDQIILQLVQGAKGMFRWVTCQIDHICELPTDRARRDALTKLPPTLYSTYERILKKVHASNIQARTIVQKTLLVIFSYSSSLSTHEICQIVSMPQDDTDTFEEDEVIEERELRLLCSSLVRTSPDGKTLEFAHYTVQEFLVEICSSHPTLNFYQVDSNRASLLVGCACLKYLTLRNYERFPEDKDSEISYISQRNSSRPFYNYAAISWRDILRGHMEDDRVSRLLLILFDRKKSACFQAWSLALACHCFIAEDGYIHFNREISRCGTSEAVARTTISALLRPDFTTLHLAATLGLSNICEILLEEGVDVNTKSLYGSPLHCAVGGLSVFADVAAGDSDYYHDPYSNLRDEDPEARNRTIQIMLGSGANILSRFSSPFRQSSMLGLLALNSMYGKDLMAAADLIKAGVEVEDEDLVHFQARFSHACVWRTPLEFKEKFENGTAITSLIEALGMPENPGSAEYRLLALTSQFAQRMELELATQTITHIALTVWVNDDSAMCAFLESTVENNDADALRAFIDNDGVAQVRSVRLSERDEGWTLVHTAVDSDSVNCLRLLLGAGCSSDTPLSDGRTPAHLCCNDENEDTLRVLLEHQISTSIQDEEKNTIWHYAAGANSAKILKLLLTQEKENNSALCLESLEGQTPICVALSSGHKEAVVALMQDCPTLDFWKGGAYLYGDAAAIGSAQIVRKLLDVGVPLDAIGPNSESPLHFIGLRTDGECARLLVEMFPHCCLKMQNDKTIPLESYLTKVIEQTCAIDDETFRALLTGVDLSSSDYGPQIWGSFCSTIVGQLHQCATDRRRIYQRGRDRERIDPKWNQTCAYLIKEGALSAYEQAHNQSALIPFARKIYEVTKQEHIEERGSQGIEERRSPRFGPPGTRLLQSPQQVFPVQIWKDLSTMILAVADAASYWLDAEKDVLLTQLLCQAIIRDDTGLIQCLLNYGVNPGLRLDLALSPLELACLPAVKISEDNLRSLLSHHQSIELDGVGKALDTLGLLYLPDDHSLWKLKRLIESNLSFNQHPERFISWPLHACIWKGANMCAEFLLDSGANPWQIENEADAVTLAIMQDNRSILSKILTREGKQSTNWKRKSGLQGGNMLHLASARGRTEILRFFLEEGLLGDIEATDNNLWTPMHCAAACGHSNAVKYLKDRGGRLDVVAKGGFYPLHFAVQNQHTPTVQVLLSLGAEQKACALGLKPLAYAYQTGNLRLVQLLDESNGSEPPRPGLDHPTALRLMADAMEIALETNNLEACNSLIDQGCPVDIQLNKPWPVTPLMSAICASRSHQIVESFLDQGAQVSTIFRGQGMPLVNPLAVAAKNPIYNRLLHKLVEKFVKQKGSFLSLPRNPLLCAAGSMNAEGLLALLDAIRQELACDEQEGCSTSPLLVRLVNLPSPERFNFTALHEAALSDSSACVQILLEASADTNLVSSLGDTPLHLAAFKGYLEAVEILVNNGADVSARNKKGTSPLMAACSQGQYSVVEFLSRRGIYLEPSVDEAGGNLALYTIRSLAAVEKKLPVWDFVLTRGIDPYQLDIVGVCAVHIAMACPAPYLGVLLKRSALAFEIHNIHWGATQLYCVSSWARDRETALVQIARNYRLVKRHLGNAYARIYSDSLVSGTNSLFYQAAHLGVVQALENFFALGIDIEWCCCDEAGTALIIASANGQLEAVKFLVRKGARIQYESNGRQRSTVSAGRGHQDVISWLLVGRFCDQYKLHASDMYEDKPVHPWSGIMGVPIRVKWEWKQMRNETLLAYARRSEAIRKELIRKGRIEQRDIWTAPDLQGDVQSAGPG